MKTMSDQDAQRVILLVVRLSCACKSRGEGLDTSQVLCREALQKRLDVAALLSRRE